MTKASIFPAPDAGSTVQLTRMKDGVAETVTALIAPDGSVNKDYSKHYYDTTVGQQSEPAVVSDKGLKCSLEKAK